MADDSDFFFELPCAEGEENDNNEDDTYEDEVSTDIDFWQLEQSTFDTFDRRAIDWQVKCIAKGYGKATII